MSYRSLYLRRGWINENAPLNNGVGRFIPQLMRLTIKFCKERPTSQGIREYIESDIIQFAKENPHVALYLKPRRNRSPVVVAEYLNGERHWKSFHQYSREEVKEWLDVMRNASGKEYQVQQKYEFTENPSIQGMWNSFTITDPRVATAKFPDPDLSRPRGDEISATEILQQMYKENNLMDNTGHPQIPSHNSSKSYSSDSSNKTS
jgi:large subunit ribosomal protein L43